MPFDQLSTQQQDEVIKAIKGKETERDGKGRLAALEALDREVLVRWIGAKDRWQAKRDGEIAASLGRGNHAGCGARTSGPGPRGGAGGSTAKVGGKNA